MLFALNILSKRSGLSWDQIESLRTTRLREIGTSVTRCLYFLQFLAIYNNGTLPNYKKIVKVGSKLPNAK